MTSNARFHLPPSLPLTFIWRSALLAIALAAGTATAANAAEPMPASDYATCMKGGPAVMPACDRALGTSHYVGHELALLHISRALVYQDSDLGAALIEANAAIRADPTSGFAFATRGDIRLAKNQYRNAIADFDNAIRLESGHGRYYAGRGKALTQIGSYDSAVTDFDEAIRRDPNSALNFYWRGTAWDRKGDQDRALADYDTAIRIEPAFTVAYNNRGVIHYARGDLDHALADFDSAIHLLPDVASFYVNRGEIQTGRHQPAQAIADYSTALSLQPDNYIALYRRGMQKHETGDIAGGDADIAEATRLCPGWVATQGARKA